MSNRSEFLCAYASRWLGRELTDEEAKLVSSETSRRAVQELCLSFAKPKPKKPKATPKKKEVVKGEE